MKQGNQDVTTIGGLVASIETLLREEPDTPLKDKLKIQALLEYV